MAAQTPGTARIRVCLPDYPGVAQVGELPPNVEVVWVRDADGTSGQPDPASLPDLAAVDFIVPLPPVMGALRELLARPDTGRLQVIQTLSAGVDRLRGLVPPHVTVCNARGAYDVPLAEWVVGAILATQRGLLRARDAQARAEWDYFEPLELAGRRVVILGLGSIGRAIADRLAPFGVDVVGVGRTAREGVLGLVDLDRILPTADILVSMLPLTGATAGLLDARRLALLPDGTLVVNGGRGRTIDTDALTAELLSGRLRAVLDVTDPEPLPGDHPLWALPNVLITPHLAGDSAEASARTFRFAGDQIRRFAAGQPLENVVERYLLE